MFVLLSLVILSITFCVWRFDVVLLWLVILSITFCIRRFDVRVVMIGYIVDHVLCLEV